MFFLHSASTFSFSPRRIRDTSDSLNRPPFSPTSTWRHAIAVADKVTSPRCTHGDKRVGDKSVGFPMLRGVHFGISIDNRCRDLTIWPRKTGATFM